MFGPLKVRWSQGRQYIVDPRRAVPQGFRGLPVIGDGPCPDGCSACQAACPTGAISVAPVKLDLGRCVFCGECERACPPGKFRFTEEVRLATSGRDALLVHEGPAAPRAVDVQDALKARFGRSLRLRSVSAGGCNACELELSASNNVNFDVGRYGIDFVASPRHADGLVLTGPLTRAMAAAVEATWGGMPDPKFVVAFGACAISGGLYAPSPELDRGFLERFGPSLYVPGCPPHPLTFVLGLMDLLGIA